MVSVAVPVVLPVFLPLGLMFYLLRVRYVRTSREVKRYEAVTRSGVRPGLERERERETMGGPPVVLREKEGLVRPACKHANAMSLGRA